MDRDPAVFLKNPRTAPRSMNRTPEVGLSRPSALLLCRIEPSDIEAMLDAYDSGMCDITTANCLSRAVARLYDDRQTFPLYRQGDHATLEIRGHRVAVPRSALDWLDAAETGARSGPYEFALPLPPEVDPPRLPERGPIPTRRPRAASPAPALVAQA